MILPVVLYGCETWSLTLREEQRLRVLKIAPKSDKVTASWRKLHNENLHDLYSSTNIICVIKSRMMKLVGQMAYMRDMRNMYRILVGKPEGKRPFGRPKNRQTDNIKCILKKQDERVQTGCIWLRTGKTGGLL